MKKFEAISGDQSLFELVGASDESVYIFKFPNRLKALSQKSIDGELIAERKAIEKYVPKVGDEFKVDNLSSELKCVFIDKFGIVYGEIGGVLLDLPIYKHEYTKIDRSPNPVNMVDYEDWLPGIGQRFVASVSIGIFECTEISGTVITGVCGLNKQKFNWKLGVKFLKV